jgi:hypothetical protein
LGNKIACDLAVRRMGSSRSGVVAGAEPKDVTEEEDEEPDR